MVLEQVLVKEQELVRGLDMAWEQFQNKLADKVHCIQLHSHVLHMHLMHLGLLLEYNGL